MRLREKSAENLVFVPMLHRRIRDLNGQTFGELEVLGFAGVIKTIGNWYCRCSCGVLCQFPSNYLVAGRNTHCGCLSKDPRSGGTIPRHGATGTLTHNSWTAMLKRCRSRRDREKKYYADKGITVCKRWRSFENFRADMGERPGPEYSIERINGNGNYEPSNCKWATDIEQNRNRSNTTMLEINGVSKLLVQWAEEYNLSPVTLRCRVAKGESGADLLRPVHQGHELTCTNNPCTCSSRRKYSVTERIVNAVRRYQEKGSPITLRRLCNRAGLNQTNTIRLCKELGFVIRPDGTEWMRRWTVIEA